MISEIGSSVPDFNSGLDAFPTKVRADLPFAERAGDGARDREKDREGRARSPRELRFRLS
jgi:hypothetical protein